MLYKFGVEKAADIDINRIIRENVEDGGGEVLLLTRSDTDTALLLIARTLRVRFKFNDSHRVAGEALYSGWGWADIDPNEWLGIKVRGPCLANGWRGTMLPKTEISKAIRQLKEARAYLKQREQPKIVVKVHAL